MASSLGVLDPALWSFMKSIVVPASRSTGFALAKLYRDELRSVRARVFAYVNIPREALSAFDTYARLCTPDHLVMTMTQCGWQGPGKPPAPVALFQMLVAHDMLLLPPKKKDADRIRAYLTNAVDADRLAPMEDFWLDPYELSHRYHYDDAMKADGGGEAPRGLLRAAMARLCDPTFVAVDISALPEESALILAKILGWHATAEAMRASSSYCGGEATRREQGGGLQAGDHTAALHAPVALRMSRCKCMYIGVAPRPLSQNPASRPAQMH